MSYAALSGTGPWDRNTAETDEVYVWRARFNGAPIRSIEDVQAIARAVGSTHNLGFDLRGVTIAPQNGDYQVDAVYTSKWPRFFAFDPTIDDAGSIGNKVRAALLGRYPNLVVSGPGFFQIDDSTPKHPALDFWRAHPVLWEMPFFGAGFPTDAFARFEGLYRGTYDQGIQLQPWPREEPGLKPNGTAKAALGDTTILWLVGGAAAAWLVYSTMKEQQHELRRRR